jgi:subtilisin
VHRKIVAALLSSALLTALVAAPAEAAPDRAAVQAAQVIAGRYIVTFTDDVRDVRGAVAARERRGGFTSRSTFTRAVKGFSARLSDRQVARLRADPAVAGVTPDRVVRATATAGSAETVPVGVDRIGAAGRTLAAPVRVAVVDTGVDVTHADLSVAPGFNALSATDCAGAQPSATAADDDNGHGTHVAGTIGAKAGNGLGVVGVAAGASIVPVKVLDANGSGSWSTIVCGLDWLAAQSGAAAVQVANMSLGGLGGSSDNKACGGGTTALHEAVCRVTRAGVKLVVAAGNDGWEYPHATQPDVPAAYDEVVAVTAMADSDGFTGGAGAAPSCRTGEADDRYASFSNYANNADDNARTIAAPGVCVDSTWHDGGYSVISGTSMASPHVAGLTALCVADGTCSAVATPKELVTVLSTLASQNSAYGFTGDAWNGLVSPFYGHLGLAAAPAAAPSFALAVSPTSATAKRGTSTSYGVSVEQLGAFDAQVSLSVSGLPKATSASWSPDSKVTPGTADATADLKIAVGKRAKTGTYTLTITGTGGGVTRSQKVTLKVT